MQSRKPAWWQLFMLVPIMFGLVAIESLAPLPGISDGIVDAGIVVLTFVAMLVWVQVNCGILEWYYMDEDGSFRYSKITVYEPDSKTNGDGNSPHDSTPIEMPREWIQVREQQVSGPRKDEKWFLN